MSNSDQEIIPTEVNQCFEIGDQLFSRMSSSLDKRVRNLDKRRTKLLILEDECRQGKALNEDQKVSLNKIPVIDGNIEMAKEVIGILKDSSIEYSSNRAKFVTKKPHPKKEEPAPAPKPQPPQPPQPPKLNHSFSQLIQFHAVLSSFAKADTYEKTLKNYAELKLTEDDLTHLRAFVELTLLVDYPSLVLLHASIPDISDLFTLLVESSKECFRDNLSYSRLHKLLVRMLSSSHNLKKLDDMLIEAIDMEDSEFAQEDAVSFPLPPTDPPQHKPTPAPAVAPAPVQDLIPSQTILNQSAEPLTEEMFTSSTTRLANTVPDNELIMTTVFVPSEVVHEPSKPRVPSPGTTHIDPSTPADKAYPDPVPEPTPTQVITFPSTNLSNISIEDDFDFLHESEIVSVPAKQQTRTKPFSTNQKPPIQSSLFGPSEGSGAGSSFMGARLPESNYKPRANLDMYPSRQQAATSAHTSNYPAVQTDSDLMRYGQKDHYTLGNQTDIQRPPQQIATSSLAQPFGGMVVENSGGAGRVENAWHSRK